ncbi:MAG TPA: sigma-70 family RNA polymerase sigma factor [Bdellovibrionota bacterium]|nr:sigma-70 family RNA polymerase sigma factor [Bdellovibrionota bacterium]
MGWPRTAREHVTDAENARTWMLQVKGGDARAFRLLYERFKGPIMSYIHSMVSDPALTEDLTQEVFLKVYRVRETYEPSAQFSTWLWTIARNACIDQLRKASNREELVTKKDDEDSPSFDLESIEAPLPGAEAQLIERADQARVQRCIEGLSPQQREALLLRTQSELPYEEIARITGSSLSSVKSLIFRAKESLMKCLGGSNER